MADTETARRNAPFTTLRSWLQRLEETGRLARAKPDVPLEFTLAAIAKRRDGEQATLFPAPGGHALSIVSGIVSTRPWIAEAMGVDEAEMLDRFRDAVTPLIQQLRAEAPSFRGEPRHVLPEGLARTLQVDDRVAELQAAGFSGIEQETLRWTANFDTAGMRALYGSFSVMRDVAPERAEVFLDQVAQIAEAQFGGQVERACVTVLYTAQKSG